MTGTVARDKDGVQLPSLAWAWDDEWHVDTVFRGAQVCTVLHCTVLYCTVLYCTVLYCTVLYCTVFRGAQLEMGGWTYAVDFPAEYHPKKGFTSCVRRRRWIRHRRYLVCEAKEPN